MSDQILGWRPMSAKGAFIFTCVWVGLLGSILTYIITQLVK